MPFGVEEFFAVFAAYNAAIWPLQAVAYVFGAAAVALLFRGGRGASAAILLVLSSMWAINGIGYHWFFFAEVNPLARVFAALFVGEAVLLALAPLLVPDLRLALRRDVSSLAALALIAFAAVVYPIWGRVAGHAYPAVPVFGVAPCPTTILTIGMLLPRRGGGTWLLAIPALWAAIGGSAAVLLAVPQDLGLLATLPILAVLLWLGRRRSQASRGETLAG